MTTNATPDNRAHVAAWVSEERRQYADPKWDKAHGDLHEDDTATGNWVNFVNSYMLRASGAGLDTEYGRQQLGKLIVTGLHYLESAVGVHGPMPRPGVTSGDIEAWAPRLEEGDCKHLSVTIETWADPKPVCSQCGEVLSEMPTAGYITHRQPEIIPTPDGVVVVEDGQATLASQPEEGDDRFGLQA